MYSSKSKLLIGVIALALIATLYLIISITDRSGKVALSFYSVPKDASITINGTTVHDGSKIYLDPNTYTVKASRAGFEDVSLTVTLEDIERSIAVALTPASDEAKKWANEHQDEYLKIEGLDEEKSLEANKKFSSLNPIAKDLPYKNYIYGIGHHSDPSDPSGNSIIIDIDAPEGYRQAALYHIRQMGYDPTDFNINFRGYSNPFPL